MKVAASSRGWIRFIQPEVGGVVNSTFPYGFNDGPVWAGKGLTVVASAGVEGSIGPLEYRFVPQLFRAQNASFPLEPNGRTGPAAFADAKSAGIDLPQRFGAGAYGRLDPGQSAVKLAGFHVALGASTANEYWGPASESPFLLGNNAPGFAHLFAGTDGPVDLGPIRLSLRFLAGRLDQSDYSLATWADRRRSISGVVVAGGIRQIPGLELGAGRLFENVWPDSGIGIGDIIRPLFEGLLKSRLARTIGNGGDRPDNQLASIFARWVFPESGFEVYGEYGREDNAWDTRDLILEPDHDVSYLLGLQRAWKRPDSSRLVMRVEILNSAPSQLTQVRLQIPPYVHSPVVQGHTQLGQILGAPSGYAGGATSVAVDWYEEWGRASVAWRRAMREPPTVLTDSRDFTQALSLDGLIFRRGVDLAPEATLVFNGDRYGGGGEFNARLALTVRAHW